MTRNLLACFFISIFLSTPVLAQPFMDGWIALEKGEYAKALKLLRKPANNGDAQSQFFVGKIYDKGYGVTENDRTAIKWYRKAAKQGQTDAINRLKEMKGSSDSRESSCPRKTFSLTVNAIPSKSRIRIMNIRPKYRDGICLKPGKYDVLVDLRGFKSSRKLIKVEDLDVSVEVFLRRK